LPGVSVVYAGPLASLGSVEPKLQTEALERELSVRKMERYVDELERLRHSDEERARLETDRARALDAERQRIEEDRQRALRRTEEEVKQRATGWEASTTFGETRSNTPPGSKSRQPSASDYWRSMGGRTN
jgi:hypothetical protein